MIFAVCPAITIRANPGTIAALGPVMYFVTGDVEEEAASSRAGREVDSGCSAVCHLKSGHFNL